MKKRVIIEAVVIISITIVILVAIIFGVFWLNEKVDQVGKGRSWSMLVSP